LLGEFQRGDLLVADERAAISVLGEEGSEEEG
jgi:hypothetical protein